MEVPLEEQLHSPKTAHTKIVSKTVIPELGQTFTDPSLMKENKC